jgi:outer membrane immunogenic protein
VIGAEGQFSWADINGDNRHDAILLANRHSATTSDVNWVTTATGRLGYAVGNALLYVKGGGAWAEFESSTNSVVTSTGQVLQTTFGSEKRSGWTAGGGIEFGLWSNWSMKAEYNFIDFGTERVTRSGTNFVTGAAVTQQRDADTQLHIAKVGINYRFGNFFGGSGGY